MIQYRWHRENFLASVGPCEDPMPPRSFDLSIMVADRKVWRGRIKDELRAWARWCALQVAHTWDAPPVVREWLREGNWRDRHGAYHCAALLADTFSRNRAWTGAEGAVEAAQLSARSVFLAPYASSASNYARLAVVGSRGMREKQRAHLRRLLLQRALPERLWGLVEGDERILCDALLELELYSTKVNSE